MLIRRDSAGPHGMVQTDVSGPQRDVSRIGTVPNGMTIEAPDAATIDAYLNTGKDASWGRRTSPQVEQ